MSSRPPLLRRRTVLGLLAGLAAVPQSGAAHAAPAEEHLREVFRRVRHQPDLIAWGHAYLVRRPGTSPALLAAELLASLPSGAIAQAELVEALRARAIADFRESLIVDLDGWRVSVTEARICAGGVVMDDTPML